MNSHEDFKLNQNVLKHLGIESRCEVIFGGAAYNVAAYPAGIKVKVFNPIRSGDDALAVQVAGRLWVDVTENYVKVGDALGEVYHLTLEGDVDSQNATVRRAIVLGFLASKHPDRGLSEVV